MRPPWLAGNLRLEFFLFEDLHPLSALSLSSCTQATMGGVAHVESHVFNSLQSLEDISEMCQTCKYIHIISHVCMYKVQL